MGHVRIDGQSIEVPDGLTRSDVIGAIFDAAKDTLEKTLPKSRALSVAITNLETAKIWALEAEREASKT